MVGFLAHEQTAYIRAIQSQPMIQFYPRIILTRQKQLLPILLVEIGNETQYAVAFHDSQATERQCLKSLVEQNELYLVFYNEARYLARTLRIPNQIQRFFKQSFELLAFGAQCAIST